MLLTNAESMKNADREAIAGGILSVTLMLRAAGHLADAAYEAARGGKLAFVFCGSGNNGGDGIGAAAILTERGMRVRVFLVGSRERLTEDSREMERRLLAAGGALEDFSGSPGPERPDVVIDAIFGVGLSREVGGRAKSAVELINSLGAPVVAADIPSGVCADTGRVLGCAVRADVTVTFAMAKIGHFVEPGCTRCGRVEVRGIGIPRDILDRIQTGVSVIDRESVLLPRRAPISHKGDYGKLLLLGGSVGYTGAPGLCARAAVRSGAGLVSLGVPEDIYAICAVKSAEEMVFPLPGEGGRLSPEALSEIRERLGGSDVCVLGMGLGKGPGVTRLVRGIIEECKIPLLIDADGLNALAGDLSALKGAKAPVVLTPHEGEFRRLGGTLTGDRAGDARAFAREHGCVLVLKGHRTMAAFPDGEVYITRYGNPGMAKGGSGDVLAGVLGAMMGQLPLKRAICTGIYLHSLAGDLATDERGEYSAAASDIIENISDAAKSLL